MAAPEHGVYNPTTEREPASKKFFAIPSDHLDIIRFVIKVAEVILSFLAFILEEVVTNCVSCSPLYFFEFVSCTAFLFTVLLLVLLSTALHQKVGIDCWPAVDLGYTGIIALLFGISAIVFASDNGGTSVELASVAFGFLATIAFVVDIVRFVMTKDVPFVRKRVLTPSTAHQPVSPEEEKLNGIVNGTE